jgi:hypothetical protein
MAGAACGDQFVGQIETDMAENMPEDSDSGLDEVHFVNLKKGDRRRFAGLTSAATNEAEHEAEAEDLGGFYLGDGFEHGGRGSKLGCHGAGDLGVRLGLAAA